MTNNASPNPDPLLRKVLLGRYVAKRIVSATAETVIYEATDQTTGAALRMVRPVRLPGAQALDPLRLREVNDAILRLRGVPGLVLPAAAGMLESNVFLLLPVVGRYQSGVEGGQKNGGSQGPRPTVPAWLKQVADTLDTVHGRGLCHGRLSPEAVVALENGQIALDGLPLALLSRAIGQAMVPAASGSTGWGRYAAPEIVAGGTPSSAADQYALARMVAESLGGRPDPAPKPADGGAGTQPALPPAVSRALARNPRDRFAGCGQFAGALIMGSDTPAGTVTAATSDVPALEMAPVLGDAAGRVRAAPAETPLELGDSFTAPKTTGPASRLRVDHEEELVDITFTKPGEHLLTERDKLSKAASFGSTNASWRRMMREFQQLPGSRKGIAKALAGVGVIIVAFVLITFLWRAAVGVTGWVSSAWETAKTSIPPDVGFLRKSGEQVIDKAKTLLTELKPKDDGGADASGEGMTPPARIGSQKAQGDLWPERPEDQVAEEELAEPVSMIDEVIASKDNAMSNDGAGVLRGFFSVPLPSDPEELEWVGGFGVRPKGREFKSSDTPLLDGTVVNRLADGTTIVGQYSLGVMKQFWLTKDHEGRRVTVSAKVDGVTKVATLNGAAFVIDESAPECLVLVYDAGELIGGQWCTVALQDDTEPLPEDAESLPKRVAFAPPTDIVPPDRLTSLDAGFAKAVETLQAAVEQLPAWNQEAREALKRRIAKGFREKKSDS
jgi:hypothetical protein